MMRFDPLDELPIHQVPLPLTYPATSDRNFYDRCIYQAVDHTGEVELITGLGVYPNLGVIDAYATVRRGDRQHAFRISDALGDDRMTQAVGPYRVEVIEPQERPDLSGPDSIEGEVHRDAVEPCPEVRLAPKIPQSVEHPHKDLLDDVIGLLMGAEHPPGGPVDAVPVAADQFVERLVVPSEEPFDQCGVASVHRTIR